MPSIISAHKLQAVLPDICGELTRDKCIGLPTETVYGLAADATSGEAVTRIFEMKGRPKFNPLICHVAGIEMAKQHGEFNETAEKLAKAFWPGPLTLVLPLKEASSLHPLVTAGLGSVGLRCPKGIACEVISQYGKPLAAPSANQSGRISPTEARHVADEFSNSDLTIIDNGACEIGLESSIIKVEGNTIYLLRPGSITADEITQVTGILPVPPASEKIEAPGMMKSHYAPDAKVVLNCTNCKDDEALLAFGENNNRKNSNIFNLSKRGDLREAAANLYAGLKKLDTSNAGIICVEPIPMEGLGIAINDRLQRAAAPKDK